MERWCSLIRNYWGTLCSILICRQWITCLPIRARISLLKMTHSREHVWQHVDDVTEHGLFPDRWDDGHQRVLWCCVWSSVLLFGQPHWCPQGENDFPLKSNLSCLCSNKIFVSLNQQQAGQTKPVLLLRFITSSKVNFFFLSRKLISNCFHHWTYTTDNVAARAVSFSNIKLTGCFFVFFFLLGS